MNWVYLLDRDAENRVGSRRGQVHLVRPDYFVSEPIVKQSQDFVCVGALKIEEIFDGVNVKRVPLEFQPSRIWVSAGPGVVEGWLNKLVTLYFLEHSRIEQIVYLLVVNLEEAYIYRNRFVFFYRLDVFHQLQNTSLDKPMVRLALLVNDGQEYTFVVFLVLVTIHGESLTWARLSITEYCGMEPIDDVFYHRIDSGSHENVFLLSTGVEYLIENELLALSHRRSVGAYPRLGKVSFDPVLT